MTCWPARLQLGGGFAAGEDGLVAAADGVVDADVGLVDLLVDTEVTDLWVDARPLVFAELFAHHRLQCTRPSSVEAAA